MFSGRCKDQVGSGDVPGVSRGLHRAKKRHESKPRGQLVHYLKSIRPNLTMPEKIPRKLQLFLNGLQTEESPGCWGFTVYCTYQAPTSTASPDEAQAIDTRICRRFQAYIEACLHFAIEARYGVKIPLDIDFIRLPSASIAEAREHFRAGMEWVARDPTRILQPQQKHHGMRYSLFVVLDDETIGTLLDGPPAITALEEGENYEDATKEEDGLVIKVVDVGYEEACGGILWSISGRNERKEGNPRTFYGVLKTTPRWLQEVWFTVMVLDWKQIYREKDEVYRGW